MFNGLSASQTPNVKYWNHAAGNGALKVSLEDDCAPLQYFATGGSAADIDIYLPSSPGEGKTITFKNERYTTNSQKIRIYDSSYSNSTPLYTIGAGQALTLIFVSENSIVTSNGGSSWVSLTSGSHRATTGQFSNTNGHNNSNASSYSNINGGTGNIITAGDYSAIGGGNANEIVNATYSFIGGGNVNKITMADATSPSANYSVICGGNTNLITGTAGNYPAASVIGGGVNNKIYGWGNVDGSYSVVVGGNNNVIGNTSGTAGQYSFIGGGLNNLSNGSFNVILGGESNTNTSSYGSIIGGYFNTCNSAFSSVMSGAYGTTRSIDGVTVFPGAAPITSALGVSQSSIHILGKQTTDSINNVICTNTSSPGTTNQVILPNNSAYLFKGSVVAAINNNGPAKAWRFEGVIKRGATASTAAIVGSVQTTIVAEEPESTFWSVSVYADTTNGGLAISVVGALESVRWVSRVETTEVTF